MTTNKEQKASVSDDRKAEQDSAAEVSRLESSRQSLTARIDSLREEVASEATKAQQVEAEAAKDYAAAIANGAAPALLKELESRMASASTALANARHKEASMQGVLESLGAQVAALDAAIQEATERHQAARQRANDAQAATLIDEWNGLVRKMLPIGAEIDRLLPGNVGWHRTHQMKIPDFRGAYLTRPDLLAAGE